jgi:alcohol dehydrogenase (NADP+)
LGATHAVLMKDRETLDKMEGTLDYIIDTIPFKHDLDPYLHLLKVFGTQCVVGSFYSLNPDFNLIIRKGKKIIGSNISSRPETTEFLKFCAENNIVADIELIDFDGINKTHDKLLKSEARYRYVVDIKPV